MHRLALTRLTPPRLSLLSIRIQQMQQPAQKSSKLPSIGTHNGTFHCDEALAVFLLRQTDTYKNAELIRTRDPAVLETCEIIVDVGAVYDPEKLRFDHHQRGFSQVFGHGFETKLSSAGLIYRFVTIARLPKVVFFFWFVMLKALW